MDKAKKVISAGAVAMVGTPHSLKPSYRERAACGPHIVNTCRVSQVVVNSEDTLIAPGDSSREGNAVMLPVVGIRRSDAARLLDGEEASISYQPIVHLTNEQRKHLRAVVIMRNKDGALATMKLDQGVASEFLLDEIEEMLSRDELVRVQVPSPTLPFPPAGAPASASAPCCCASTAANDASLSLAAAVNSCVSPLFASL